MSANDAGIGVVVGASGGLGRALWQTLRDAPELAAAVGVSRQPAPEGAGDLWQQADTSCAAALDAAAAAIGAQHERVEVLIVCTGMLHGTRGVSPEKALRDLDSCALQQLVHVNAFAPLAALRAFVPLLKRGGKAITLSAMVGSITDNRLGGWYGYRMSKAALNMGLRSAAIELSRGGRGPTVVALHPGTTLTPLSEPYLLGRDGTPRRKHHTAAQSAAHILEVARSLEPSDNGKFFNWDGTELPW